MKRSTKIQKTNSRLSGALGDELTEGTCRGSIYAGLCPVIMPAQPYAPSAIMQGAGQMPGVPSCCTLLPTSGGSPKATCINSNLNCFALLSNRVGRGGQEGRRGLQFRFYSAFSPGSLCTLFLVLALPKKVLGMAVAGTTSDPRLPGRVSVEWRSSASVANTKTDKNTNTRNYKYAPAVRSKDG